MANTYTSLHDHVIFSTKNREPWIVRDIGQCVHGSMTSFEPCGASLGRMDMARSL